MVAKSVNQFGYSGRTNQPASSLGQVTLSINLDFTAGASATYILDPTSYIQQSKFGPQVFGMFVDNSNGANEIVVSVDDTQMSFPIPAFTAGWFPLFATAGSKFTLTCAGGATAITPVILCNWQQAPFAYSGFAPFQPGDSVQAFPPGAVAITSRNTVLGAGAANNVFPAVAVASQKTFENATGNDVWYNFNAVATGNPANGDQYLAPGEKITTPFTWAAAISFFSLVGGQILAYEWK